MAGCTRALCCKPGVVPTSAPTDFVPACRRNVVYFTDFLHEDRVNSIDVTVDDTGVAAVDGSIAVVAKPGGADGIMVNPQNSQQLFVGGQQPRVFVVDTTNANPATNWWRQTSSMNIFNVVPMNNDFVLGFALNGLRTISRHHIVGGTLPNNVAGNLITLGGYPINVSAVIALPAGKFLYTSSGNGGEVSGVGEVTLDPFPAVTGSTAAPFMTIHAHSGVYEPYSNTLLFWGGQTISQYTLGPSYTHLGSLDVTTLIGTGGSAGFRHVDNGAVDGQGRFYLAANNGVLMWFDIRSSLRISTPDNMGSIRVTPADGLDAITAPVCIV